jgi:O-antigen/teichoic acid export membrane protein
LETGLRVHLGLRLATSLAALVIVTVIAVLWVPGPGIAALVVIVYAVAKVFEAVSDCFYGYLQRREQMRSIALSLTARGLLSLAVLAAGVSATGSVVAATFAYAMSWGAVLLFLDVALVRRLEAQTGQRQFAQRRPSFDPKQLGRLFLFSAPLGIIIFLNIFSINIPRYIIASHFGDAELGYFASIAAFVMVGSTVVNAVAQASLPSLSAKYAGNRAGFLSSAIALLLVAAGVGASGILVAWLFGPVVLRIAYTPEFAAYSAELVEMMAAAALLYLAAMCGSLISATRRFRSQVWASVLSTATILVAAILLVPEHGVSGGILSLALGYAVKLAGQLAILCWLLQAKEETRTS